MSYTPPKSSSRTGPGMVRRTYYVPQDVVAELDRAVVQAQASAYVERAPDKSMVIAAVLRAGLAAMPAVIASLRASSGTDTGLKAADARSTRWQRPVAVPTSLDELRGHLEGTVRLPIEVHSSGAGPTEPFDLADPAMRAAMYQLLLRQGRLVDLQQFINGAELRRMWPQLWLPAWVREAWTVHFPEQAA